MTHTTSALIVAAGRGVRAKSDLPKQYLPLQNGRAVLTHTIAAFANHPAIDSLLVVIHPQDAPLYQAAIKNLADTKLLPPALGGDTRQASVRCGLAALADNPPKQILIHDAARPFVSADLITRCLTGLGSAVGAIPALPVTDTLKRADTSHKITETVSRDGLWQAQTPQAFHYQAIYAAHQKAMNHETGAQNFTDDAAVAEFCGLPLALVAGDKANIKLTHAEDFAAPPKNLPRTGSGFDVHRFGAAGSADHIMLGGIAVPHDRPLLGHSDADVVLHALTDALLGALAMGDIGTHFPPDDPTHKNRNSADFLRHAVQLAAQAGARLTHADITIICETPKLAPHRAPMRARLAELLGLPESAMSVKATTTEQLGFLGRGEGLAAQATLTLLMPSEVPRA